MSTNTFLCFTYGSNMLTRRLPGRTPSARHRERDHTAGP